MTEPLSARSLYISLLGRFQIRIADASLSPENISGRKARALLKLLALQRNHQLVRDQAMDLLWPDLDASGGAAQLYKAIHHLRKAFVACREDLAPDAWIEITENVVRLAPPDGISTDLTLFEHAAREGLKSRHLRDLEQATALYTGDLLPMDLYVPWTETPRDHIRQLYLDLLLALAEQYRLRGDLAAAAETFRLALDKDPLLEAAHRGLMRIFARQGQRNRALRQFRTCCEVLSRELGVAPTRETQALHDDIESQQFATEGTSVPVVSITPVTLTPLVGRETECQLIEQMLDRLRTEQGGVLVIEGPVGIGKTRLAQDLVARARRQAFQVLLGSVQDMEGPVAYSPFIEILQAALRERPDGQELIPAEIALALPGYAGDAQPVPNTDRRAAQGYLFARVLQFMSLRAASCPLVIVVEDLHAADEGSLELFHYLARHTADVPLLLAATCRSDQGPATTRIQERLRRLPPATTATVLSLGALQEAEHRDLLEQQAAKPGLSQDVIGEIFRLSEGNPLFALELYRHRSQQGRLAGTAQQEAQPSLAIRADAVEAVPSSLRYVVRDRVESVTPPARRLLYVAAVSGRDIPYGLLEALWPDSDERDSEPTEADLLDLLEELIETGLLDERGIHYRFRHALFRAAVYESLSEARRRTLHARVARSLVRLVEREEDLPVEQVAHHYRHAGDARQAVHYLMLAGDRAEAVYAHEDALNRFREALRLLEPARDTVVQRLCSALNTRIGDVYRAAGYLDKSYEAYEQALSLIHDLPVNRAERAELHRKIALVAIFTTSMENAGVHLAEAWRMVGSDPRDHARLHILRALYLWHFNRLEEAASYAHRALELADSVEADLEAAQACEILAMAYLPLGRWKEGLMYERRRLRQGRWSPDIVVATDAHLCLWEYHVNDAHMLDRATAFMREVASEADRLGDVRCVAICQYALGTIRLWQGDTAPALEHLTDSLDLHHKVGSPAGMAYTLARRAVLHTLNGAIDLGWKAVQEGIEQAHQASIRDHCLQRLYGVGVWNRLEAQHQPQVAALVAQSEALLEAAGPCTACSLELYPWLAFYYLEHGNVDQASACAETLEHLSSKTGNPVGEAYARMVRSGVEAARGDSDDSDDLRTQALDLIQVILSKGSTSPIAHFFDRMADRQRSPH